MALAPKYSNSSQQFFQVNFETSLDNQIKLALHVLALTSKINVHLPVPANQYTSGTVKYGGLHSILVTSVMLLKLPW
jgi:hypothetical protein